MSVNTFTLFVVLPDDSVCTLRNLVSGVNIEEIKARLELIAGLPSHIFILIYPDGEKLQDHQKLLMRENIKDGYVLRVHVIEHWETLFNSVFRNNIESVYHNGGVHLKGNMVINAEESGKIENAVYDRGCVALYMSSFLGLLRMCNMLITVGKYCFNSCFYVRLFVVFFFFLVLFALLSICIWYLYYHKENRR